MSGYGGWNGWPCDHGDKLDYQESKVETIESAINTVGECMESLEFWVLNEMRVLGISERRQRYEEIIKLLGDELAYLNAPFDEALEDLKELRENQEAFSEAERESVDLYSRL